MVAIISGRGLPWWLSSEGSSYQCKRHRFKPGSGRSPGQENDNLLQCSCLGNRMDEEPSGLQSIRSQESDIT